MPKKEKKTSSNEDRQKKIAKICLMLKKVWLNNSNSSLGQMLYSVARDAGVVPPYFMTDEQVTEVLIKKLNKKDEGDSSPTIVNKEKK